MYSISMTVFNQLPPIRTLLANQLATIATYMIK